MVQQHDNRLELVQSYTRVRFALGMLGLSLPLILILGGMLDTPRIDVGVPDIEPTISDFYHTTYRDIFVGALCAIGVFLISYRGYRREAGEWIDDDWLATIAGLAAFGVAFFPNEGGGDLITSMTQKAVGVNVAPTLHYLFAGIFFASLAGFCLFKFPKTARLHRRRVYLWCGWTIIAAVVLTAIAVLFKRVIGGAGRDFVLENNLIFWFEAFGVWAFALSWLVKSKADLMLAEAVARRETATGRDVVGDEDEVTTP